MFGFIRREKENQSDKIAHIARKKRKIKGYKVIIYKKTCLGERTGLKSGKENTEGKTGKIFGILVEKNKRFTRRNRFSVRPGKVFTRIKAMTERGKKGILKADKVRTDPRTGINVISVKRKEETV